ncbi:MAG: FtsW/RodA/SpoVE family cell cycle protein [Clostridiales bacterium]|nr:FtsW/RodA/SpoVE family cell cycle protein [Clostridiales bacterium]
MKRRLKDFDFSLLAAVILLSVFGIIVISSATRPDMTDESAKQQIWFAFGLVLSLVVSFIDYHFVCKFYIAAYLACLTLLLAVLLYNRVISEDVVARWFYIGPINIQPSEFAKIFMTVFLAGAISRNENALKSPLPLTAILMSIAAPTLLILVQPSLSASSVLLFLSLSILFAGGLRFKYISLGALIVAPIGAALYFDMTRPEPLLLKTGLFSGYQIERLQTFLNPDLDSDKMYQTLNSIAAIASGQISGKGLYNGVVTQTGRLPYAQTDFIFSVIGEEFGFIGCAATLAVTLFVILKCLLTAQRAADMEGKLIASGVASMFAFQAFVNVGVATSLLPNTGMPFPFVSYGGSSLWINMIAVGLVINIGMTKPKSMFER